MSEGLTDPKVMGRLPTISVITATYNAARDLPRLMASLRGQTDRDFQWVVVDGGSSDGTVTRLQASGDVVSILVSEPDFGIYDALNKAIGKTSSEYYLVVGADDELHPEAIRRYKEAALRTDADIVTASVSAAGGLLKARGKRPWLYGQRAYVSGHSVGALIRRKLHERHGYYSHRFPLAADQYFIKLACRAGAVVAVEDFVAGYYSDAGKSSVDALGAQAEFLRVQVETEKYPWLQVVIFLLRLLRHFRRKTT